MRRIVWIVYVISLGFGCGGASQPAAAPPPAEPAPAPVAEAEPPPQPIEGDGTIARAALEPILDAGLGRFLQGVETEPVLEGGRFVGFRLISLYPSDERMADVGLETGDVIQRINGQPIERPEQALSVWNGLRVASELFIEYQRGEEQRELRFEIVD
jgi:hypothetical protein